jgi:tetratricopeptide (TPR) repeat protein
MKRPRLIAAVLCTALQAGVALASWYDDYEAGLKALHDGQFQVVVQKMTAAINGNPKENNNSRTYGNVFINYHPYYYRAIGYMNLGKYEQAVADLEKTSGPGPVDRGSIESLMQEAKKKLADIDTKPQPPPIPPPGSDPALRSRAEVLLEQANARLQAAVQRRATEAPAYQSALQRYIGANAKLGAAKSNDDLNAIITEAGAIIRLADSAQPAPPPPIGLDPALRSRAQASLTQANTHLQSAAQRKATDAQAYQDAMQRYACCPRSDEASAPRIPELLQG